jgi:hypothetical protein
MNPQRGEREKETRQSHLHPHQDRRTSSPSSNKKKILKQQTTVNPTTPASTHTAIPTSVSYENERVRVRKEKEEKMREREEREERLERETKEKEYQKYLQEEHERWLVRDKRSSKDPKIQRTFLERLFLNVGEKSKFDPPSESDEATGGGVCGGNEKEVKILQGTLAAELLELIEKSRITKPPALTTAKEGKTTPPVVSSLFPSGKKKESERGQEKGDGDEEVEEDSVFDEDDYFREIAALSLEGEEGEEEKKTNSGKVIFVHSHSFS